MRRHCERSEATHSPSAPYEWIASSLRSSQRRDNPVDLERRILNLNREGSEDRTLTPRAAHCLEWLPKRAGRKVCQGLEPPSAARLSGPLTDLSPAQVGLRS